LIERSIDFVFCTMAELEALGQPPSTFARSRSILWIIKQDKRGVDCICGDRRWHIDAPRVKVSDDLGAGDAFAGAFLASFLAGESIEASLAHGSLFAERTLKGDWPLRTRL